MTSVRVDLGPRSYEVRVAGELSPGTFGSFARVALNRSWTGRGCRTALVVTDANLVAIAGQFAEGLRSVGIDPVVEVVPAGEGSKSLDWAAKLLDRLVAIRADRHAVVLAVGGGVVGDLAGFVAATYARGIALLMAPTSLLAMVDSAVGGKVGVNLPAAKNIVGAFHQPAGVWIATAALSSLPARELRCGLAEVVKYGVILDDRFFEFLEARVEAILGGDEETFRRIVVRCCELKAEVVSGDEREETGLRAVLNFGHTIGHAIEAVAGYGGRYQHGEAVAAGMVLEARLARRMGWVDASLVDRLARLLARFGLPIEAPELDPDRLIDAMGRDKKNERGAIRFVLPRAIGRVEQVDGTEADIRAVLGGGSEAA